MKEECELLEKAYDYASRRNIVSQPVIEAYIAGYNTGDNVISIIKKLETHLNKEIDKYGKFNGINKEDFKKLNLIKKRLDELKEATHN